MEALRKAPTVRRSPLDRHGRLLTLDEARPFTPFNRKRDDQYAKALREHGITVYHQPGAGYRVSEYSLAEYLDGRKMTDLSPKKQSA